MKTLIVYDSYFGNTQKVAEAIGQSIEGSLVYKVGEIGQIEGYEKIIIGSPTRAFRATKPVMEFIWNAKLKGKTVMVFDTRMPADDTSSGFLKAMMGLFGFAAKKMAKAAKKQGGVLFGEPVGFVVTGSEGPLREGEIEKAIKWAGGSL